MMTEDGSTSTKTAIITAAAGLLRRFTVSKLTMDDVARSAGVARQTIYKHFTGKDDLLIAIFVNQMEQNQHPVLVEVLRRSEPSAESLLRLVTTELGLARQFNLFDETLEPSVAPRMAELVFGSDQMAAAREAFWMPILAAYEAAGVLRPGLDHRALVRWLTYQQFWLLTHPTALTDDDQRLTGYLRDFLIAAIVSEVPAPSLRLPERVPHQRGTSRPAAS